MNLTQSLTSRGLKSHIGKENQCIGALNHDFCCRGGLKRVEFCGGFDIAPGEGVEMKIARGHQYFTTGPGEWTQEGSTLTVQH